METLRDVVAKAAEDNVVKSDTPDEPVQLLPDSPPGTEALEAAVEAEQKPADAEPTPDETPEGEVVETTKPEAASDEAKPEGEEEGAPVPETGKVVPLTDLLKERRKRQEEALQKTRWRQEADEEKARADAAEAEAERLRAEQSQPKTEEPQKPAALEAEEPTEIDTQIAAIEAALEVDENGDNGFASDGETQLAQATLVQLRRAKRLEDKLTALETGTQAEREATAAKARADQERVTRTERDQALADFDAGVLDTSAKLGVVLDEAECDRVGALVAAWGQADHEVMISPETIETAVRVLFPTKVDTAASARSQQEEDGKRDADTIARKAGAGEPAGGVRVPVGTQAAPSDLPLSELVKRNASRFSLD